ncbi:hypothetical protein BGX34_008267 [Mortierella sp. NVP85]|nr:hypothetical protein BGX34_008267 [Mortierella sp. NVP85]
MNNSGGGEANVTSDSVLFGERKPTLVIGVGQDDQPKKLESMPAFDISDTRLSFMSSSASGRGSSTMDVGEIPFEETAQSLFLFVDEGNPMERENGRHKNCKMLQKEALAKAKRQYEQQKLQQHQKPQQPQAMLL